MSSPEDYTEAQASDPGTQPAILGEIATHRPDLRPAIAGNPTAYPDLLDWLANLNDPAVNAALAARAQGTTGPVPVPAAQSAAEAPTAQQPPVDATQVQQPVPPQEAPAQHTGPVPGQPTGPGPAEAAYGSQPAAAAPAQPSEARWNFRGMGINDLWRDVIAALLLLLSIPMVRSEEHTSELQSRGQLLIGRLL